MCHQFYAQALDLKGLSKIRDTDLRATLTRLTTLTSLHLNGVASLVEDTLREVSARHSDGICGTELGGISEDVNRILPQEQTLSITLQVQSSLHLLCCQTLTTDPSYGCRPSR
jgi:hypothetical protein